MCYNVCGCLVYVFLLCHVFAGVCFVSCGLLFMLFNYLWMGGYCLLVAKFFVCACVCLGVVCDVALIKMGDGYCLLVIHVFVCVFVCVCLFLCVFL